MKLSRNYLTQDEVSYIVFEICKKANPFEMEIIKIALKILKVQFYLHLQF